METTQIGGVDSTRRVTKATLAGQGAKLLVRERLLTDGQQQALTDFVVDAERGRQRLRPDLPLGGQGAAPTRRSAPACGATAAAQATPSATPSSSANGTVSAAPGAGPPTTRDAALIHEAAIGKIAGRADLEAVYPGPDRRRSRSQDRGGLPAVAGRRRSRSSMG